MIESAPGQAVGSVPPPGRRASDQTPIGRIIGPIERAYGTGDYELAAELLGRNPIVAWCGFAREKLAEILAGLEDRDALRNEGIELISALIAFGDPEYVPAVPDDLSEAEAAEATTVQLIRRMAELRFQGRVAEALRVSTILNKRHARIPALTDSSAGWGLSIMVQHATTAMLAGDFPEALRGFTQVQMYPASPVLMFLVRNAFAKAAAVEALYGDPVRASALIERSEQIPRSESWVERETDAWRELAAAMAESGDPSDSVIDRLERFPPAELSEMWPFHTVAMHRALRASGDWRRAQHWIETLAGFSFPRIEGNGYAGSALPYVEAMIALQNGDLSAAREAIGRADASLPMAVLLVALIDIAAGNPRAALEPLLGLRDQTKYLRALDLWRLTVLAEAFLALGEEGECRTVLEHALDLPGGIRAGEARSFSPAVRSFAETGVDGWPGAQPDEPEHPNIFVRGAEAFTERELDLLRALATGRSREQIAKAEFISINTLKAHLRSVYRKLEVTSRAGAILEAERRGLV